MDADYAGADVREQQSTTRQRCSSCGASVVFQRTYTGHDACPNCGALHTEQSHLAVFEDVVTTTSLRAIGSLALRKSKDESEKPLKVTHVFRFYTGLQLLLQQQIAVLISVFHCNPGLADIAAELYFDFLQHQCEYWEHNQRISKAARRAAKKIKQLRQQQQRDSRNDAAAAAAAKRPVAKQSAGDVESHSDGDSTTDSESAFEWDSDADSANPQLQQSNANSTPTACDGAAEGPTTDSPELRSHKRTETAPSENDTQHSAASVEAERVPKRKRRQVTNDNDEDNEPTRPRRRRRRRTVRTTAASTNPATSATPTATANPRTAPVPDAELKAALRATAAVRREQRQRMEAPRLWYSLALCYAACLRAREPVQLCDLIRWARTGLLPYLAVSYDSLIAHQRSRHGIALQLSAASHKLAHTADGLSDSVGAGGAGVEAFLGTGSDRALPENTRGVPLTLTDNAAAAIPSSEEMWDTIREWSLRFDWQFPSVDPTPLLRKACTSFLPLHDEFVVYSLRILRLLRQRIRRLQIRLGRKSRTVAAETDSRIRIADSDSDASDDDQTQPITVSLPIRVSNSEHRFGPTDTGGGVSLANPTAADADIESEPESAADTAALCRFLRPVIALIRPSASTQSQPPPEQKSPSIHQSEPSSPLQPVASTESSIQPPPSTSESLATTTDPPVTAEVTETTRPVPDSSTNNVTAPAADTGAVDLAVPSTNGKQSSSESEPTQPVVPESVPMQSNAPLAAVLPTPEPTVTPLSTTAPTSEQGLHAGVAALCATDPIPANEQSKSTTQAADAEMTNEAELMDESQSREAINQSGAKDSADSSVDSGTDDPERSRRCARDDLESLRCALDSFFSWYPIEFYACGALIASAKLIFGLDDINSLTQPNASPLNVSLASANTKPATNTAHNRPPDAHGSESADIGQQQSRTEQLRRAREDWLASGEIGLEAWRRLVAKLSHAFQRSQTASFGSVLSTLPQYCNETIETRRRKLSEIHQSQLLARGKAAAADTSQASTVGGVRYADFDDASRLSLAPEDLLHHRSPSRRYLRLADGRQMSQWPLQQQFLAEASANYLCCASAPRVLRIAAAILRLLLLDDSFTEDCGRK